MLFYHFLLFYDERTHDEEEEKHDEQNQDKLMYADSHNRICMIREEAVGMDIEEEVVVDLDINKTDIIGKRETHQRLNVTDVIR